MDTRAVAAAGFFGLSAGMRSMLPLAALGVSIPRNRLARVPLALPAAAELVYDKLPEAGDRTKPGPFVARILAGALAGGLSARWLGAATGALAAVGSTFFFHRARAEAAQRVPKLAAAGAEDLLAIGASAAALWLILREP